MSLFWPTGNKDTTQLDRQLILNILARLSSQTQINSMLDTGAGHGILTRAMVNVVHPKRIEAIDLYPLAEATDNIVFSQGDLNHTLPYPDDSFDLVTSIHTIEHIIDTDKYLDEMRRVLKPGGYLLLHTVNLAAFHYRLLLLFGFMPNCLAPSHYQVKPWRGDHGANPHKSVFTYKALLEITKKHGFELVRGISHTIYPLPTFLANMICFVWPNLGLYASLLLRKSEL